MDPWTVPGFLIKYIFQFDDLSRLRGCIRLQDVTLRGNPISRIAKYRDQVRASRTNLGLATVRHVVTVR